MLSPAAALTQSTEVDAGSLMFGFGSTPTRDDWALQPQPSRHRKSPWDLSLTRTMTGPEGSVETDWPALAPPRGLDRLGFYS